MGEHRTLRRVLYAVIFTAVVLVGGAGLVLHSRAFRSYALGKILQTAGESTGTRISSSHMDLAWYPLGVVFGWSESR